MPNSERLKAASHRPLEDSSRIKACWACTSRKVKVTLAASRVSRIRERPSRSTWVSYGRANPVSESVNDQKVKRRRGDTCLFAKDHGNLALACQIAFSNLFESIVRFAFTKSSRVHATMFLKKKLSIHLWYDYRFSPHSVAK